MLLLVFALPFAAALLCLALNRSVPTRWLGFGAAAALLVAALGLVLVRSRDGLPIALPEQTWAALDDSPVRLAFSFDGASWPFALLALGGGALGVLALALAVPARLRGFGGLFAAVLLLLLATAMGIASQEPILLPFAWALAALLSFVALRTSGAAGESDALPIGLLAGLIGTLVLLAAALAIRTSVPGSPAGPEILICWALVGLLALGAPPFHAVVDEVAVAPAALAGLALALGLPLLGGYALLRFAAGQGPLLPPAWRIGLTLAGLLTLLACAAGAAGAIRLRRLIGWLFSAQMGLVLVAVAQGGATLAVAAPALLANAVLTTLVCYTAVAVLELRAGTDDLTAIRADGPLVLPGLALLIAAASAVGVPGTLGLWARFWLLDELLRTAPWTVPALLAGSALIALAYLAPLAAFWHGVWTPPAAEPGTPRRGGSRALALACPAVAALPLLIMGVAPQLAWNDWLAAAQRTLSSDTPVAAPALPGRTMQFVCAVAAVALVALPLLAWRGRSRQARPDPDMPISGIQVPHALGQSLGWLAWIGAPASVFQGAWDGLLGLSRIGRRVLALFEERYYLAGLLIALIVMIMLLI